MKKYALLALLVAPLVFAQVDRTVTVQHATEREDGTPLALGDVARVEIECFVSGSSEVLTTAEIVPPATSVETEPAFTPGAYQCRAATVDTLGQRSTTWTESNVFTVGHPCQEAPSPETCAAPMAPASIVIQLPPSP